MGLKAWVVYRTILQSIALEKEDGPADTREEAIDIAKHIPEEDWTLEQVDYEADNVLE